MYNLKIITSTTRPGRKGPAIASWIANIAAQNPELNVEILELGEINLPMMDEPVHPAQRKYEHAHTKAWSATIDSADAFIIVTAEYNFGIPAPLKNALDYLYHEWTHKPVGIVSYGGISGGTRAAQMLKQVVTTLKMFPLYETVILPFYSQHMENDQFKGTESAIASAEVMVKELLRLIPAMQTMREVQPA